MAKSVELLLTQTVEGLGIVGDVVTVRSGYARNYLMPHGMVTIPSEEAVASLAQARAAAEAARLKRREHRTEMTSKLDAHEISLARACNDQGMLYGSVTQRDIVAALAANGFEVNDRAVRLPHAIKRLDTYDVLIRLEKDLEATIKVVVLPDRALDIDERDEMEFDEEGELIEKPARAAGSAQAEASSEGAPADAAAAES